MRQSRATSVGTIACGLALVLNHGTAMAAKDVPLPRPRPHIAAPKSTVPPRLARPLNAVPLNAVPLVPLGFQKPAPQHANVPPRVSPPARPALPLAAAATAATAAADVALLKRAIDLAQANKSASATEVASTIKDPLARKLAEWAILRNDDNGLPFARYAAFIAANPGWPSIAYLRRRAEAVLWQDKVEPGVVRAFFAGGSTPLTAKGRFALARALLAAGDRAGAQRQARAAWRTDSFSSELEAQALAALGDLLTRADHKARMDARLYADDIGAGMRAAKRLGKVELAIAHAWAAVIKRSRHAKKLLDAVPASARHDAGHMYSRIKWLRRNDKPVAAAQLLHAAPHQAAQIINPDEWWIERRLVSRALLEKGHARAAYQVAREAVRPTKENYRAESQFMAGWIALRFVHDVASAQQHFARIALGIDNPIARARAAYWQGRAAEAAHKRDQARRHYSEAAKYSTAYYGQLARAKLGLANIVLSRPPALSAAQRASIARLEVVRAASLLYAVGEKDLVVSLMYDLAGRVKDAGVLTVLAELAGKHGDARATVLVGKVALGRGLPFAVHAFPTFGIPKYKAIGPALNLAVVYSIARQESTFNQRVVSRAKAMGLMQVTPAAGRYIARKFGVGYSRGRLLSDPVYNVQMGAAELGDLMQDYRGSYILTFVGYNAGRGRVREWLERFGDPRDPKIDPIDWVERIPFSETRNYVERVLENLQIYRALFGGGSKLMIEADLRRGAVAN